LPPGAYRLGLTLYDEVSQETLQVDATAGGAAGGDIALLGWLRVGDPPTPAAPSVDTRHLTPAAQWAEGLVLDEIVLPASATVTGDSLPVHVVWNVVDAPDRDLTLFLHLLDANGEIVAQLDRRTFDGRFPTPVWRRGEKLAEQIDLPLPPALASGQYALRLGLYDEAGRSLLVGGEDSLFIADALLVR
jgi:hypothetical protein